MMKLSRAAATVAVALSTTVSTLALTTPATAEGVTLTIACGAIGKELDECKIGAEAWAAETGNNVEFFSLPKPTNERLALIQQLVAAKSDDVDVFALDVIWPGILADHLVDLSDAVSEQEIGKHFPSIVANNTVEDRLVAIPWFVDTGLLYYREDLLEEHGQSVPETWDALESSARAIQDARRADGEDDFWGYVWQGRAYEGLTCSALELINSHGGGTILDTEGNITVNNAKAAEALTLAASWIGEISPDGTLNYAEEDVRGVFQSGKAAFMRNWPYAWSLANSEDSPVKGQVGVTVLPKGPDGEHSATLGGRQIAVSAYSAHQEEAIDLIRYLTSEEEQRRRALDAGYNPTIVSLYEDPELIDQNPVIADLKRIFSYSIARPSRVTGEDYAQVSNAFWTATHSVLSGEAQASEALSDLERRLSRILQ